MFTFERIECFIGVFVCVFEGLWDFSIAPDFLVFCLWVVKLSFVFVSLVLYGNCVAIGFFIF